MGKKNLASLMSGIMGDSKPQDKGGFEVQVSKSQEVSEELIETSVNPRYSNVGRPKKGTTKEKKNEIRATFIVDPEQIRKIKYISLVENALIKDIMAVALSNYIEEWEQRNGSIKLPRLK